MQGNQEESASMSLGRFSHVYDLMDMGNKAFRENRFEEVNNWNHYFSQSVCILLLLFQQNLCQFVNQAVNCYSRAHNIQPADPVILNNRCAAYLR